MTSLGSRDWEVVSVPPDEPEGPDEASMALLGEGEVFNVLKVHFSVVTIFYAVSKVQSLGEDA